MESNVDLMWDEPDWRPFMVGLAEFGRLILHDRRGLGVSSRNVAPPNLETQAADILAVLDAAGSERAIVTSGSLSLAPYVLLAATHADRVAGMVWNNPTAKGAWAPDYPWGETDTEYEARQDHAASYWGSTEQARLLADSRAAERLGIGSNGPKIEHRAQDVNTYARVVRNSASPDAQPRSRRAIRSVDAGPSGRVLRSGKSGRSPARGRAPRSRAGNASDQSARLPLPAESGGAPAPSRRRCAQRVPGSRAALLALRDLHGDRWISGAR